MRLRHELRAEGLADRFEDAALDLQFSSLSSVGNDTKWLEEPEHKRLHRKKKVIRRLLSNTDRGYIV